MLPHHRNHLLRLSLTALLGGAACKYDSMAALVLPPGDVTIVLSAAGKGPQAFSPDPFNVTLASGGKVIWVNADYTSGAYGTTGVTHTVTSDIGGQFDSGNLAPAAAFSHTFTVVGTYQYHCAIHGQQSMNGSIVVQ